MYIKHLDLISPKLTFHYKTLLSHSSIYSSILSIMSIILCISATIYFSLDIINHLNPTSFFYYHQEYDVGHYPVNESSMFHFFNIIGVPKEENSERLFQIFGFMKTYISNYKNNIGSRLLIDHYTYGPCSLDLNSEKLKELKEAFSETTFESMEYCIDGFYNSTTKTYINKDDPNFKYPIISHGTSHPNYTSYSIIVQRCENDTFYKFNSCKSENYIDNFVTKNQLDAVIGFLNQEVDVLNYSFPIKHKFISITFSFTVGTFSVSNLNFQPLRVNTHNGFFFDHVEDENSFYYEQNDIKNYETEYKIYTSFHLWMQNKVQIYERNYKRIQNIIADTGGTIKAIMTLASLLNLLGNKFQTFLDVESILFNKIDGLNKSKTFHKYSNIGLSNSNVNVNVNKNIMVNERKGENSVKIDNFVTKEPKSHNSQNISINNSLLTPLNTLNNKTYNNFHIRDSNSYLFIKDNRILRKNIGFFSVSLFFLFHTGKITNKKQNYVDIIKWYYTHVISEQNIFDIYFFCARLEKTEQKLAEPFIYPSPIFQNYHLNKK